MVLKQVQAFIISAAFGFMMAALKPFCIAIVKKIEVMCSRSGRPNETFDTPRIVRPFLTSFTYFTVARVATAA